MTTLQEKIAVMQHHANGGKVEYVEYNRDGLWKPVTANPTWNWAWYDYRIKKEPRKFSIGVYKFSWGNMMHVLDDVNSPDRVNNQVPDEIIEVVENVS